MTKTMLLMAETIWRFSLQDIEATLRQVCNRVLSDSQADVRTKRARGLIVMGRVFRSYGSATLKLAQPDLEKHFADVGEQFAKVRRCGVIATPAASPGYRGRAHSRPTTHADPARPPPAPCPFSPTVSRGRPDAAWCGAQAHAEKMHAQDDKEFGEK